MFSRKIDRIRPRIPLKRQLSGVLDARGQYAFVSSGKERLAKTAGIYEATCTLPASLLNDGVYRIGIALTATHNGIDICFWEREALTVAMSENLIETLDGHRNGYAGIIPGPVRPKLDWTITRVDA